MDDPIAKCCETLRILIALADPNGVVPAEQAVERLLTPLPSDKARRDMISLLQGRIGVISKPVTKPQVDFLNLVLDYTEKRDRELAI